MELKNILIFVAAGLFSLQVIAAEEVAIPRSVAGDKGKYYLIETKGNGGTFIALHKRVGVMETGYTRTEINCASKKYRELAYGEDGPNKLKPLKSNWTEIQTGSSKSDLVLFVCSRVK